VDQPDAPEADFASVADMVPDGCVPVSAMRLIEVVMENGDSGVVLWSTGLDRKTDRLGLLAFAMNQVNHS
jgi:hypothetical protein